MLVDTKNNINSTIENQVAITEKEELEKLLKNITKAEVVFQKSLRGFVLTFKCRGDKLFPIYLNFVKSIPERRFDRDAKKWIIPATKENLDLLKDYIFNFSIKNEEEFNKWIETQADVDTWRKLPADIEIEGFYKPLYDFQKQCVNWCIQTNGRAFITDEQGLGKTIEALAYIQKNVPSSLPVLIICPNIVKFNWRNEIQSCLHREDILILNTKVLKRKKNKVENLSSYNFVIVNYDIFSKKEIINVLNTVNFSSIIIDEVHYIKNLEAKRTQAVVNYIKKKEKNVKHLVGLSGTPIRNNPVELLPFLQLLNPTEFEKTSAYISRYCVFETNDFGTKIIPGVRHWEELNTRLINSGMIRRKKEEVLKELPDKIFINQVIEISNRQEYVTAERNIIQWLKQTDEFDEKEKKRRIHNSIYGEYLTQMNYLRDILAKGKFKGLTELIEDLLENVDKLVVFGIHKKYLKELSDYLTKKNIKNSLLTGDTRDKDREKIIKDFQEGDTQVFIAGIQAGGVGITLTAASNVIIFEYPWTPDEYMQAIDRLHRIGQKNSVNVYNLLGENTIDVFIVSLLRTKQGVANKVIDGIGGEKNNPMLTMLMDLLKHKKI